MKLLFLAESFPTSLNIDLTGGIEAGDWHIATRLAKNHQVHVVTASRQNSPELEQMNGVVVHRIGIPVIPSKRESVSARVAYFRACLNYAPSINADIIHASNVFTQFIATQLPRHKKQKHVARIADIYQQDWVRNTNFINGILGSVIERYVLDYPWSGCISWSEATKKKLLLAHINTHRLRVIYGGLDKTSFIRPTVPKNKRPAIIAVGRLVSYKHIDSVIKAVALLNHRYPDISLSIVGEGPQYQDLKRLTSSLSLDMYVRFYGSITRHRDVITKLKQATVFCLPSTVEGFGLATLESCICGTPYIAVATPATTEITKRGMGGFLLKSPDEYLIAEKINELLSNSKLYNTKVHECSRLANQYEWSKSATQTEAFFKSI